MKKLLLTTTFILTPVMAFAQEVAEKVTVVDFSATLAAVSTFVLTVLGVLAVAGINWVQKKTKTEKLVNRATLDSMVDNAVTEAANYVASKIEAKGWGKVDVKNEAVAIGLTYVQQHSAEIVKAAGLDSEKIIQKLEAKFIESPNIPLEAAIPEPKAK